MLQMSFPEACVHAHRTVVMQLENGDGEEHARTFHKGTIAPACETTTSAEARAGETRSAASATMQRMLTSRRAGGDAGLESSSETSLHGGPRHI
jgi:hypothetical protein